VVAKRVGKREHPLANGNLGKDAVDEVGRGVRHTPAPARRAEAAALAREGDEAVVAAAVTVQPQEAVRQDATAQEGAELLLDEARYRLIAVGRAREKALELLADDLVEEGLLRLMALVLGHEVPSRDLRG
jgi:hypothetical protein